MNKEKAKKTKQATEKNQIKIVLFGDEEEKNKSFIQMYANTGDIIEKNESFEFNKEIKGNTFKMLIYFISSIDDKIISMMKNSNAVFLLFNMASRISFDNILDKWFIWLRDNCGYKGNIFIFGDFDLIGENKSTNPFLVTSENEIQEVIDCAEIKGHFCKIGGLENDVKREKIDGEMINVLKNVGQYEFVPEDEDEGGSFKKNDGCCAF